MWLRVRSIAVPCNSQVDVWQQSGKLTEHCETRGAWPVRNKDARISCYTLKAANFENGLENHEHGNPFGVTSTTVGRDNRLQQCFS